MGRTQEFEDDQVDEIPENEEAYREAIREGSAVAVKSAMIWTPLSAVLLLLGFKLSGGTFLAAEHIFEDAGTEWDSAFWPAALYGLFGLGFGSLIGWRIGSSSGLVGGPAWRIGTAAVLILCLMGVLGAMLIFDEGLPKLLWISTGLLAAAAIAAVTYFSKSG